MNRLFATLLVFAMILFALTLSVRQTLELRDDLGNLATWLVSLQVAIAAALLAIGVLLLRRRFTQQVKTFRRSAFVLPQPLRRLFSAVWS